MQLNDGPFCSIKDKSKTIEMRLFDEKRQKIKVGDVIKFLKKSNHDEFVFAKVKNLHRFKNFEELYKNFDKIRLGYKQDDIALPEDMAQYYSEEEIKLYGVVGIEIEVI
ncbi:MAG: RNA-binding protein [Clostridia bacterium]|nr:RNA-binding protein [Clostridia bacterium]